MEGQRVLPEGEMERRAGSIKAISKGLLITAAAAEVAVSAAWLFDRAFPLAPLTIAIVVALAISAAAYRWGGAGRVRLAGYVFVYGFLLEATTLTYLFGGFAGPLAIVYFLPILVAGMMISISSVFLVATLSAVAYLAIIPLEQAALFPQVLAGGAVSGVTVLLTAVARLIFFYLVAFLSWFAASRLQRALRDTRRYAGELQTAYEKLQASEEELRASNEELEAANEELRATEEELRASNEELETANQELKEAQEQLVRSEKLAAIGQLAGGVGHELRNPLGAIKNAVYYIRGKLDKSELSQQQPRVMEFLDIVDDEINSSNKIINDLLGFSRVGKPAVSLARIEQVIDDAIAHSVIPENIALARQVADGLPGIEVDTDQMRQVLVNIITNAVQAMPEGGRLAIEAGTRDSFLEMKITDTGKGMPPEIAGKVFDPLFTTRAKGIGLGLAVCKSIVDRHGGSIAVNSRPGEGTAFTIRLPLKQG